MKGMICLVVKETGVWGIEASRAISYGKSYRMRSLYIYLLDILFMVMGIRIMLSAKVTKFGDFFGLMLILTLSAVLALGIGLKDELYTAAKFIRKYGKLEVKCKKCHILATDLYFALPKRGQGKLNRDDSADEFISFIINLCRKDVVYSKRLMLSLDRLIDNPDGDITVYIYYVESKRGKRLCDVSLTPVTMYDEKPVGSTLDIISEPIVNDDTTDADAVTDVESSKDSENSLYVYVPKHNDADKSSEVVEEETDDSAVDSKVVEKETKEDTQ